MFEQLKKHFYAFKNANIQNLFFIHRINLQTIKIALIKICLSFDEKVKCNHEANITFVITDYYPVNCACDFFFKSRTNWKYAYHFKVKAYVTSSELMFNLIFIYKSFLKLSTKIRWEAARSAQILEISVELGGFNPVNNDTNKN